MFRCTKGVQSPTARPCVPGGKFSRGLGLHVGCRLGGSPHGSELLAAAKDERPPMGALGLCFFMDADIVLLNSDPSSPTMAPILAAAASPAAKLFMSQQKVWEPEERQVVRNVLALVREHTVPLRSFFAPHKFKFFEGAPPRVLPGVTGEWRSKDYGILAVAYVDFVRVRGYPLRGRVEWGHEDIALKEVLCAHPLSWYSALRNINATHAPPVARAATLSGALTMERVEVAEIWHPWHQHASWSDSTDGLQASAA